MISMHRARNLTVSVVFTGTAAGKPVAADDARAVGIYHLEGLPPLTFDHARILEDYRGWIERGGIRR